MTDIFGDEEFTNRVHPQLLDGSKMTCVNERKDQSYMSVLSSSKIIDHETLSREIHSPVVSNHEDAAGSQVTTV